MPLDPSAICPPLATAATRMRLRRALRCGFMIASSSLALVVAGTPARAQEPTEKTTRGSFLYRGHVELDFESEHNFNLDRAIQEDFTVLEPEIRLRLGYIPSPRFQLIGQIRPRRKLNLHYEDKKKDREWVVELEQLYFTSQSRSNGQRIFIGRTRFRDNREWLYDMNLDGLRMFFTVPRVRIDVSMTRLNYYSDDLLHENLEDPIANIHVYAAYALPPEGFVAAWWLAQDDRSTSGEQVHFLGLRSGGEPRKGFVYWAELVQVLGDFDGEKLSGTGFDVGFHYELPVKLKPYPIVGYAFGTGDDNPDDGTNHTFRQTGYQDNNGRFGGVIRYKFYGEMLEPDLGNMGIVTSGLGIRPWKRTSFDLVYHKYDQHHPADEISGGNLDADPDGVHTDLGQELDFVIGFRQIKDLRVKAVAAWFFPGRAYDPAADYAFFTGVEFRYYY